MAPGPGGSPFRARWDTTSVSLYSVVNEPGELFFPHPVFHTFFGFDSPSVGTFFQGKSSPPIFHTFLWFERKVFLKKLPHPVFHTFFRFYNLSAETFFRESSSHPIFHTFFAFGRKKYQTFLQKNGRHSLSFDNRIKKTSFAKSFFGQRKSRKRKPDRLILVGALEKRFAAQRRNEHSLCCSFSVFLYILSLV